MLTDRKSRLDLRNALGVLRVVAGAELLVALSYEIIAGDHLRFSTSYLNIQLGVCILFLADFFVRWVEAPSTPRFLLRNALFFLLSVPYLNIIVWLGVYPPHEWMLLIGLMPMARAFLAFYIVIKWMVSNKIQMLLTAYIVTVVLFTYLAALIFYAYEWRVNSSLHGFGNALWWAWMNVTTVGAQIFAVTPIGKVLTVLLPTLGMMMFPIFTSYILQQYAGRKK